jgi:transposase-like protein
MSQQKFAEEFRQEAVRQVVERGYLRSGKSRHSHVFVINIIYSFDAI